MLRREGAGTQVPEMVYRAVVREVIIFGSESWVLSEVIEMKVGGTHTGLLRQITGNRSISNPDGKLVTLAVGVVV